MPDESGNGWRGRTDAKVEDLERRVGIVETHPFVCPQLKVTMDH